MSLIVHRNGVLFMIVVDSCMLTKYNSIVQLSSNSCLDIQLHTLFVVQSKKTEEMEKVSQGYGMLLSACGLRTEEMRAQYSIKIKEKVYFK